MNKKIPSSKLKKADIFAFFTVLLLIFLSAFLIYKNNSSGDMIYINADGKEYFYSIKTDKTENITSGAFTLKVDIKDGKVCVKDSDCRDKVCVNTPPITSKGGVIVCVPAKVIIKTVKGDNFTYEDGADFIIS